MRQLRRVVITGLGVCTPIGLTVEHFWQNLLRGASGLRAAADDFNFLPSRVVGLITEQELEDAKADTNRFLSKSASLPVDWKSVSQASMWGLIAAKQALVQAGFRPRISNSCEDTIGNRSGVHFGTGMEGILEVLSSAKGICEKKYKAIGPHVLTRSLANMPAGVISRLWGLRGPCMATNTACATGLHSIGDAYRMIQHGEADLVVAGGCEAPINPWVVAAFSRIRALSTQFNEEPTLAARPFDTRRNGFVVSEGAGAVVLQAWPPPDDLAAYCSTATPIAEVIGYGRSGDAYNLVSPAPNGDGAYRSMRAAICDAGLDSVNKLGHINCHATSTPLGDVIELAAIARLVHDFSSPPSEPVSSPIVVNSIKGHLGHCLAGAGAVEAVCTALTVSRGCIPGTRNLHEPIPLSEIGNLLTEQQISCGTACVESLHTRCLLPGHDKPQVLFPQIQTNRRIALTNSFGFGGTNASLVLAEWKE